MLYYKVCGFKKRRLFIRVRYRIKYFGKVLKTRVNIYIIKDKFIKI
jgi:hypothetical protein